MRFLELAQSARSLQVNPSISSDSSENWLVSIFTLGWRDTMRIKCLAQEHKHKHPSE